MELQIQDVQCWRVGRIDVIYIMYWMDDLI